MSRHLMLVTSNAVAGREDEYHRWYDEIHIPEVLEIPGVLSAERFAISAATGSEAPPHRFAAVYELEADDPQSVLDRIGEAAAAGRVRPTDAMEAGTIVYLTSLGAVQRAPGDAP